MNTRKHTHAFNLSWDRVDLTKPLLTQETVYRNMRQLAKKHKLSLHNLLNIASAQMAEFNPVDRTQPTGAWLVITFDLPCADASEQAASNEPMTV